MIAMPDGFEMLADDHRTVERLFETYRHDNEDSVVREICEHLTSHASVEEAVLYPTLRRYVDGGDDLADAAEQEHGVVKTLIARIYDSPPDDLLGLVTELRRDVEQHVRSEESDLFPQMREAGVDAERLGADIEAARATSASS
jgi:hemerythrin superfamily protein